MSLTRQAIDAVADADHLPLGSLALAIADLKKCVITLRPFRSRDEPAPNSKNRAMVLGSERHGRLEYIVYFPRSDNGPSTLDPGVRYSVAHELAHILLEHPVESGSCSPAEELEAHIMAGLFLRLQGGPTERKKHTLEEIVRILANSDLTAANRWEVINQIESAYSEIDSLGGARGLDWLGEAEPDYWPRTIRESVERCEQRLKRVAKPESIGADVLERFETDYALSLTQNLSEIKSIHAIDPEEMLIRALVSNMKASNQKTFALIPNGGMRLCMLIGCECQFLALCSLTGQWQTFLDRLSAAAIELANLFSTHEVNTAENFLLSQLGSIGFSLRPGHKDRLRNGVNEHLGGRDSKALSKLLAKSFKFPETN